MRPENNYHAFEEDIIMRAAAMQLDESMESDSIPNSRRDSMEPKNTPKTKKSLLNQIIALSSSQTITQKKYNYSFSDEDDDGDLPCKYTTVHQSNAAAMFQLKPLQLPSLNKISSSQLLINYQPQMAKIKETNDEEPFIKYIPELKFPLVDKKEQKQDLNYNQKQETNPDQIHVQFDQINQQTDEQQNQNQDLQKYDQLREKPSFVYKKLQLGYKMDQNASPTRSLNSLGFKMENNCKEIQLQKLEQQGTGDSVVKMQNPWQNFKIINNIDEQVSECEPHEPEKLECSNYSLNYSDDLQDAYKSIGQKSIPSNSSLLSNKPKRLGDLANNLEDLFKVVYCEEIEEIDISNGDFGDIGSCSSD